LTVLAYNRNHVEIPDSLADACAGAMISDHETLADTSFEKIFRESYQLWQELDHDDLTNKISKGYQFVNDIENFCQSSRLVLLQKLDEIDFKESLWSGDPHLVTDILAQNRRLYFFMGMRYENTKSFLNEAKYLRKIIAEIDSICLAIGYGKYKENKEVSFTENAIKDDSTAIVQH
jgi:hypothetical protein